MDSFYDAISKTISIGFVLLGVYVGLLLLRIGIGVAGFMLGSSLGTVILAVVLWEVWKRKFRDKFEEKH